MNNAVLPLNQFPFKSFLSLDLLLDYWQEAIHSGAIPFNNELKNAIANAPELRGLINDPAVLAKHDKLIRFLMSAVIPSAQSEHELVAATVPFRFQSFFSTAAFDRQIDLAKLDASARVNLPGHSTIVGKTIHACLLIAHEFYQVDVTFDKPIIFTIRDEHTGLDKAYKIDIGRRFFKIVAKNPVKHIDHKILKFLTEKVYDIDLWLQYINPNDFEFHGFMLLRMIDVTEQEMLSSIKYDLLEKNAVSQKASFASIQHKLRSIFNMPDIRLGVAFFGPNNQIVLNSAEDFDCWKGVTSNLSGVPCDNYNGSIYERSWMEKRFTVIENLEQYPFRSAMEERLLSKGIRNIMLAPLVDGDQTIGMIELTSSIPNKLTYLSVAKVENALPMFTAAVKRVREEMDTEIRAIIQQECTNIHPSVEWRFFKAGTNLMAKRRIGQQAALEEIVFKDVHPLFGLADVRNSSLERSNAIRKDLEENLVMARELLNRMLLEKRLPVFEELIFKIGEQMQKLSRGLASGDETTILAFLKDEVNPLIVHFQNDATLTDWIREYLDALDSAGVIYKRRKAFEDSLSMINKMIASHLDEAQKVAQEMYPHYFEKYQTDGVEYTLYVGSSLVEEKPFDPLYLRNFRLWQLMLMCEIDRKMEELKPSLTHVLDITQLMLIHDQPLSIRFRPDEKQFDVDGAYDIRYEILKKRIDKAHIRNTGERLTQPGKIAIVYNQTKSEDEYRRYLRYLAEKKLIEGDIEYLQLEELQGASGLKAMRISIARERDSQVVVDNNGLLKNFENALSN